MSTSVDSRIATMKFDNKQFEKGAAQSLSTLAKLKQSMNFDNAGKGLQGISNAASKFNLGKMGSETESVKMKFGALQVAAVAALGTIVSKATSAAMSWAKSFTIGPILDGFREYETNLKSIQTIQANTDQPLTKINKSLDELNAYSDQTIYNFSEMAKNIGTFTAAGVDLKTSVSSIKGIANLAALSGSSSEQAASAMYQLSQAIASGRVGLQDWNSVVNAGMGGKKLQNQLAQTAVAMGKLEPSDVTINKMGKLSILGSSFRESIQAQPGKSSWLESDILVNTLATLDGRFSRAALSAEKTANGLQKYSKAQIEAKIQANRLALEQKNGVKFTDEQFKSLMKMSDAAYKSATEVKTLGQVFDVAKETIASGWAGSFRSIFGNLNEAKTTFTGMSNVVNGFIEANAMARNKVLADWKKLGGRTDLIEGITNIFKALGSILKPIGQAFRDIFPPMTGKKLAEMTEGFRKFTEGLILSKDSSNDIRNVFKVLFSVLKVGLTIAGGVFDYFFELAKLLGRLVPGVLDIAGAFGELVGGLFGIGDASAGIRGLFDGVIAGREKMLGPILDWVNGLLHGFAGLVRSGADGFIEKVGDAIAWATPYFEAAKEAVEGFVTLLKDKLGSIDFSGILGDLQALGRDIAEWFKSIFSDLDIGDAFSGMGDSIMSSLGKVDIGSMFSGAGAGAKSEAKGIAAALDVGSTVDKSKSKIQELKAELPPLESIGQRLKSAWGGISDAFGEVFSWLKPIGSAIGDAFGWLRDQIKGFTEGLGVQDALAVVNTGFFIAAYTMFVRFTKKMGGVADSLSGMLDSVGGVFDGLSGNLQAMERDVNATALLKIAGAVAVLVASIYVLTKLDPKEVLVGLTAIAVMGKILTKILDNLGFEKAASKEAFAATAQLTAMSSALVALSTSLLIMAGAIAILGRMDLATLGKGLGAVIAVLAVITTSANIMAKSGGGTAILAASAAIGVLAFSLSLFAATLKLYSKIDPDTLKSGGFKIAAMLIGLGIAMQFFPPNVMKTAATIVILSAALMVMAGALKVIGSMSLWDIIKAMIGLGGAMAILVIGLNALGNPATIGSAVAMVVVAGALRILVEVIQALGEMEWGTILKGLGALALIFATLGIASLLLAPAVPILAGLGVAIGLMGLAAMAAGTGMMLFATGFALLAATGAAGVATLTAVVMGVASLFPLIMQQIGLGMRTFATVIKREGPGVVQALGVVLRELLREIAKSAPDFGRTLIALLKVLLQVIWAGTPPFIKAGFRIIMEFLRGIRDRAREIAKAGIDTVSEFLQGIRDRMDKLVDQGVRTVISFVNGIAKGIRENKKEMSDAGGNLGRAIGEGLIQGLGDLKDAVIEKAKALAGDAIKGIKDKLLSFSPSRRTRELGQFAGQGLALGMDDERKRVNRSGADLADGALTTMRASVARISDILSEDLQTTPTITPVLNLDQFARDAGKISSLMSSDTLSADLSLSRASALSADRAAAAAASATATTTPETKEIKFEQHITAPQGLSEIEVYRSTRNLLAYAKEALDSE